MKYSELSDYLKSWIIGEVAVHKDGSISVDGDVSWSSGDFTSIPIKFRRVSGSFDCGRNGLTSLENAPDFVGGDFWCHHNQLTSLENAPDFVGGSAWCFENNLISLDGLGEVRGKIHCDKNPVPAEELVTEYWRKRARKELVGESLAIERILS